MSPDTDLDDLPESIDEPEDLGLDSLHGITADEEKAEELKKEELLPKGWYTTRPPITVTVQRDQRNDKRLVLRSFAQVERDGRRGAVPFRLSPELRRNTNTGRYDMASRLYVSMEGALKKQGMAYDAAAIKSFLETYPVEVRVTELPGNNQYPDPSNLVVQIRLPRE